MPGLRSPTDAGGRERRLGRIQTRTRPWAGSRSNHELEDARVVGENLLAPPGSSMRAVPEAGS
jgi:hypothetical protein